MKYENNENNLVQTCKDSYNLLKDKYSGLVQKTGNLLGALTAGLIIAATPYSADANSTFSYNEKLVPKKTTMASLTSEEKDLFAQFENMMENRNNPSARLNGESSFIIYADWIGNKDKIVNFGEDKKIIDAAITSLGLMSDKYFGNNNQRIEPWEMQYVSIFPEKSKEIRKFVNEMYKHGFEPNAQLPREGISYEGLNSNQRVVYDFIGGLLENNNPKYNDMKSDRDLQLQLHQDIRPMADRIGDANGMASKTELKEFYRLVGEVLPLKANEISGDRSGQVKLDDVNGVGQLAKDYKIVEILFKNMFEYSRN